MSIWWNRGRSPCFSDSRRVNQPILGHLAEWWPRIRPPFSFVYDGKTSQSLLPSWKRTPGASHTEDRTQFVATWLDTKTGLKVIATATAFNDFPAVEWVLRFENTGTKDSPILENVQALDIVLGTENRQAVVLDQIRGDDCSPQSFLPIERPLKAGESVSLAPYGGRSSRRHLSLLQS